MLGGNIPSEFRDYDALAMTDPSVISGSLEVLDHVLSIYPDGYFEDLMGDYYRGIVFYLTGELTPLSAADNISNAGAFVTDAEGLCQIALNLSTDLYPQTIVHELTHAADYRFAETFPVKMKKRNGEELTLRLVENPDVAKTVGELKKPGQTLVGFAAETDHLVENAQQKLQKKHLDLIVANDVTQPGAGFNSETNAAVLISEKGMEECPLQSKRALADIILDRIMDLRG